MGLLSGDTARVGENRMSGDHTRIEMRYDPLHQRMDGIAIHGNTPFSVPYITQVDDTLFVGGCATGLVLPDNIEHVVSLYPWETYQARHELRTVLSVVMYDSDDGVNGEQVREIAAWVNNRCNEGPTLVHCQAGLNRSNLVAATALILRGMAPAAAIALLREKRSPAVLCNETFEAWLTVAA